MVERSWAHIERVRSDAARLESEGRLRLANLAEPIFEALANGEMTLDMAKAYASTDDQAKQCLALAEIS